MKKHQVIEQLQAYLVEELRTVAAGASEQERARAGEIQRLLTMYRFLPVRELNDQDVICPASLVELELNGIRAFYFIVPQGGGLITQVDGQPLQVITPQSPLGEALLGKRVGEIIQVPIANKVREYRVISLV